jgi:gliding motility-associated-like protein
LALLHFKCYSQEIEIFGFVDGKLVTIDPATGNAELFVVITRDIFLELQTLTYDEQKGIFHTIADQRDAPFIISFSITGELIETPPGSTALNLNGESIRLAEALAYNEVDHKLYAAVSLNGGFEESDLYAESIVEVDPTTGSCTFVTEIHTDRLIPDIDVMAFSGNKLYLFDGLSVIEGEPVNDPSFSFYELTFEDLGELSTPNLIYSGENRQISDFTIVSNSIYFTQERDLYKLNLTSKKIEIGGMTHNSEEFNGDLIKGIANSHGCLRPIINLGKDSVYCDASEVILKLDQSEATFTWQDGSHNDSFNVKESGIYWVQAQNDCGIDLDTIKIDFDQPPFFELGDDIIICENSTITLEVDPKYENYKWSDGSTDSKYLVEESGYYWIRATNSCGTYYDSISIKIEPIKEVDLGKTNIVCGIDLYILDASTNASTYLWSNGSTEATLKVFESGIYSVEVTDICGNRMNWSTSVRFSNSLRLIPNVITPNGDGLNDSFEIRDHNHDLTVKIFNRIGRLVFESDNYQNDWNCKGLSSGTYFYYIIDNCGKSYSGTLSVLK